VGFIKEVVLESGFVKCKYNQIKTKGKGR